MSITFNPTKKPTCPLERNFFDKEERDRAGGLFNSWARSILEGQRAERFTAPEYCRRTFVEQTGLSPDQAPREFLEPCIASHEAFMQFVRSHRIN